jgi:hypothetical protein
MRTAQHSTASDGAVRRSRSLPKAWPAALLLTQGVLRHYPMVGLCAVPDVTQRVQPVLAFKLLFCRTCCSEGIRGHTVNDPLSPKFPPQRQLTSSVYL